MHSLAQRLQRSHPPLRLHGFHLRSFRTDTGPTPPRRPKFQLRPLKKTDDKSEWWTVDGEMHEIGDNVPPRERFHIPSNNFPNRRRKQLREQFMRRTRLVFFKDSEHEGWCKKYMELYQELRENWERLYWDEGYSKKLAQDHANYDSAEDDDQDFSPYRRRQSNAEQFKDQGSGRTGHDENWERVNQIRDKFEYDREKRMRERAFAPMTDGESYNRPDTASWNQHYNQPDTAFGNQHYDRPDMAARNQHYNRPDMSSRDQPYSRPGMASRNLRYNQPDFRSRNQLLDTERYFPQAERDSQRYD